MAYVEHIECPCRPCVLVDSFQRFILELILGAVCANGNDALKCCAEMTEQRRTSVGHSALDRELCRNIDLTNPDSDYQYYCTSKYEGRTDLCMRANQMHHVYTLTRK